MIDLFRSEAHLKTGEYIFAHYYLESTVSLRDAALNLAIGQSVGNPKVRSEWETDELFENHSCFITDIENPDNKSGNVIIAFPIKNTDFRSDGISHLICQLMGGQLDIDTITKCHLNYLRIPDSVKEKFRENHGIQKIREYTKCFNKPLLGGIVKPKTGLNADMLKQMVGMMVENGINFIKEDEIMANLPSFPIKDRVKAIAPIIKDSNVVYCYCINSDPFKLKESVDTVIDGGGNGIHVNIHGGLGIYRSVREYAPDIFIHFQKSGDKLYTNPKHEFHIKWKVICMLAVLSGVDFIHVGMLGGYSDCDQDDIQDCCKILTKGGVIPALSCGMHPGLVEKIRELAGVDWMANVGGALHGHPGGTAAGVRAMSQAIGRNYGPEYFQAIEKWGVS